MTKIDEKIVRKMLERACELSLQSTVLAYPNPRVGAVVFDDDGKVISEGFTANYGGEHAEAAALRKIHFKAEGMNMAVALEPCNHFGKTPPCSHAILNSGIKRVFIAKREENKSALGGADFLMKNGVEVEFVDEFSSRVELANRFFFKGIREGVPWITVKVAVSKDGFITDKIGKRTKISGSQAQIYTHKLRSEYSAIAVGSGSVNIDDPFLNVRLVQAPSPRPVIFSKTLSLDPNAKIFKRKPIVLTSCQNTQLLENIKEKRATIKVLSLNFTIKEALKILFEEENINSILVEGGAKLISSFLVEDCVDEFQIIESERVFKGGLPLFDRAEEELFKRKFSLKREEFFDTDVLKIFSRNR